MSGLALTKYRCEFDNLNCTFAISGTIVGRIWPAVVDGTWYCYADLSPCCIILPEARRPFITGVYVRHAPVSVRTQTRRPTEYSADTEHGPHWAGRQPLRCRDAQCSLQSARASSQRATQSCADLDPDNRISAISISPLVSRATHGS